MKIALINKLYPPHIGGIEYYVRALAENLVGYSDVETIEVLVANNENKSSSENITKKLHVTRLPCWCTIASTPIAPAFIKELEKLEVDILHFNFPYPFADFAWLAGNCKIPFVITYHSDILRQKLLNRLYAPIRNQFFERASKIMATSPNLIQSSTVLQKFENKVEVVPLGINPQKYLSDCSIENSKSIKSAFRRNVMVLFVGRFVYYKGVEVLVEAFKGIEAELVMVGSGTLKEKLQTMVQEYQMEDKVHFRSGLNDEELAAYFNACDIFVLPSVANTEAYGLVQLEAQACGKPVISTNLPTGVPFVNRHGETGLVVEPNDVQGLRKAIQQLVDDSELRVRLGKQAKKRMLAEFTDVEMTKKVYDIYCEILSGK